MPDNAYSGLEPLSAGAGDYNVLDFVVRSILGRIATTSLVQVRAVNYAADVSPVGLVDVQPMVAQLDGKGNAVPHGIIHNVPYFRLQGGANAVIIDPVVGDIGIAVFASHDISSVKSTKTMGNPGSRRRFAMSDALYIGGALNGTPSQYIRVSGSGIDIVSPNVTMSENLAVGNGATGTFSTPTGQVVTVISGIVTGIV